MYLFFGITEGYTLKISRLSTGKDHTLPARVGQSRYNGYKLYSDFQPQVRLSEFCATLLPAGTSACLF